jgi:hypothetical protein
MSNQSDIFIILIKIIFFGFVLMICGVVAFCLAYCQFWKWFVAICSLNLGVVVAKKVLVDLKYKKAIKQSKLSESDQWQLNTAAKNLQLPKISYLARTSYLHNEFRAIEANRESIGEY